MKKINATILFGIFWFIFYLINYFENPDWLINLALGIISVFFILCGIFELREYHNKKFYFTVTGLFLAILFILFYIKMSSLVYNGNVFIDLLILCGTTFLMVGIAYDFSKKWVIYGKQNKKNVKMFKYVLIVTIISIIGFFTLFIAVTSYIGHVDVIGIGEHSGINSTGGSFENQWFKFNYPPELIIVDASDDNNIDINIYNGTNQIGWIYNERTYIDNYGPLPESNLTSIDGRKTLKDFSFTAELNGKSQIKPSAAIYLNDHASLDVIFGPGNRTVFDHVINTLIIKKDDVK